MKGRYVTEGPAERLGGAIMPIPARLGMGYQSWGAVDGYPGTLRIPAPPSQSGAGYENNISLAIQGVGAGGMGRPDSETPFWTPGIYYMREIASRFHGAIESDTQMPIPAKLPSGKSIGFVATGNKRAFVASRRPRFLGNQQVVWPFVAPKFTGTT